LLLLPKFSCPQPKISLCHPNIHSLSITIQDSEVPKTLLRKLSWPFLVHCTIPFLLFPSSFPRRIIICYNLDTLSTSYSCQHLHHLPKSTLVHSSSTLQIDSRLSSKFSVEYSCLCAIPLMLPIQVSPSLPLDTSVTNAVTDNTLGVVQGN